MTPQKLIYTSKSWADFVRKISGFQDKKRGTHFEWFVKFYLLSNPKYKLYYNEVWHSSEFSLQTEHISKLKLPIPEQGYDLIGLTKDGFYEIIQCKYKNNIHKNIVFKDIDSSIRVAVANPARNFVKSIKMCSNLQGITRDKDIDNQAVKINGVFGGDFESLDEKDFKNIRLVIDNEIPVFEKVVLKPHQKNAIILIKKHFVECKESKGQIIHACGTGKTLTAYYAYQKLKPKLAIYLVPSLQLVTQTLNEWSKESLANNKAISPFIVCSDKSNEKIEENDPTLWLQELGIKVSNKKEEMKGFLNSKQPRKVIFSTYQSSKILATNINALDIVPDLCFFDEAHNTTSSKSKVFGCLLSNENLIIKKRLFLTATPKKLIGLNHKYYSMDDEKVYGKVIDEITFKEAIEELEMLNDYRIITQTVSDTEARKLLKDNPFVIDKEKLPEEAEMKLIASALTIKKVVKNKKINNVISFHSRVKRARLFSKGLKNIDKEVHLNEFHVSGKQSGTLRQRILSEFSKKSPSIVTNAMCLSEGVDVPAVDAVIFVDPKQSKISITQAIGRALRKPEGQKKGMSYVIVPTIINEKNSKDIDEAYQEILMVLRAISEHDGRIVEYFRLVKEGKNPPIKFLESATEYSSKNFDLESFNENLHIKTWDRVARLGRRPFEQAREYARQSPIKTHAEWLAFIRSNEAPLDLPLIPEYAYKEWISWYDFLGKRDPRKFISFNDAREYARSSSIKSRKEWVALARSEKAPYQLPLEPHKAYDEWVSWYDFLGKHSPEGYLTFDKARQYARNSDIKSRTQWDDFIHSVSAPTNLPKAPQSAYKKDWLGWPDFLNNRFKRRKNILSYSESKKIALKHKITTGKEWKDFVKSSNAPKGLSTIPDRAYKEWISWYDFLGKAPKCWRPFEDVRKFARNSSIDTQKKWFEFKHSKGSPADFPVKPNMVYKDKWEGWSDFLGAEKNYVTFKEAMKFAEDINVNSQKDWYQYMKSNKAPIDIPYSPQSYYKSEWTSWCDFFKKRKNINKIYILPFGEAREFARKSEINTNNEWVDYIKSNKAPNGLPMHPSYSYDEWTNWFDFLGKKDPHKYKPYKEAKKLARKFNIKSQSHWNDFIKYKKAQNLPQDPRAYYKKHWQNWYDFLGTNPPNKYRTFKWAREYAKSAGIKSRSEWIEFIRSKKGPKDLPLSPNQSYKNEWIDWHDFLGKKKPEFLSFERARDIARSASLLSYNEWYAFAANRAVRDLPKKPEVTYKNKWISWYDFLGKKPLVKMKSFMEAREFARKSSINSSSNWHKAHKLNKIPIDIPLLPDRKYKEEWISWYDFLGTKPPVKKKSFEEVRAIIQKSNVNTQQEWRAFTKSKKFPADFPAGPDNHYKKQWISWSDFLRNKSN